MNDRLFFVIVGIEIGVAISLVVYVLYTLREISRDLHR